MAIFRKVHTSFWSDVFVSDLTPEQKYFYLYLMTNDKTTQCGIYEISKRQISFDTGYNSETIDKLFEFFISKGKVVKSSKTNEIVMVNWVKYNNSSSPKVQQCVNKELSLVKDRVLIEYLYGTYTQSQEEQEQEEEQEEDKEQEPVSEFMKVVNEWYDYKKARRETYKTEKSKKMFEEKLLKLSNNNPVTAKSIVEQSMANNWAGIFELKETKKENVNMVNGTVNAYNEVLKMIDNGSI